jgi:undecaprenyl-diphosphatase
LRLAAGRIDQSLLLGMRTRGHGPVTDRVAQALGAFGELGAGWLALGSLGAALGAERRIRFLAAAAAAPAAVGINYAVKATIGRDRPVIEGHPPLAPAPSKLSFPSAHAASAVAGAVALARVVPGARLPLYGLAALICAGRPYLGMHYPSDVLAGAALGLAVGRAWPLPAARRGATAAGAEPTGARGPAAPTAPSPAPTPPSPPESALEERP